MPFDPFALTARSRPVLEREIYTHAVLNAKRAYEVACVTIPQDPDAIAAAEAAFEKAKEAPNSWFKIAFEASDAFLDSSVLADSKKQADKYATEPVVNPRTGQAFHVEHVHCMTIVAFEKRQVKREGCEFFSFTHFALIYKNAPEMFEQLAGLATAVDELDANTPKT